MTEGRGAEHTWRSVGLAGLVALGLSLASALWLGPQGLNLADEGFLYYGIQRVAEGEVPLRDFQSYEPARYYWCVFWGKLFGPGLLGMRRSIALFQFFGLWAGLVAFGRSIRPRWLIVPVGVLLALWMFPRHKVFESSLAMMAVLAAQTLILVPGRRVQFACGVATGLAATFGRNHGIYWAGALGLLILFLAFKRRQGPWIPAGLRGLGSWIAGILLGFSPVLALGLFVPGFAQALVDSVLFFAREGSNLPKPYPWPWSLGYGNLGPLERFSVGALFLLPVLVYPLGILGSFRTAREALAERSLLIAASWVGLFYCHQASVRSDAMHLAQSVHPALLACVALPWLLRASPRPKAALLVGTTLCAVGSVAALSTHPLLARYRWGTDPQPLVEAEVLGDTLRLEQGLANYVRGVTGVFESYVPAEERYVFMAPTYSAFYPLLGKVSPVWRIYFLWQGSVESQDRIIAELEEKSVRWVFLIETAVDGRLDLRFQNSHPRVWGYFQANFERIPTPALPPNHVLLRRP